MKVVGIRKVGKARVINLTVHKNHTFITKQGIVVHNCDHLSQDFQAAFRGFIDDYSANCRFIFTGNFKNKVIEPLLDRLMNVDFAAFERKDIAKSMATRLMEILDREGVDYDKQDLAKVIYTYYPRMRSMVAYLQKSSVNGKLVISDSLDDISVFDDIMQSLHGDYHELIAKVNALTSPDNMYTFLYNHAGKYFGQDAPKVIITAARYQHMASMVRDKHLNLMACLTELK